VSLMNSQRALTRPIATGEVRERDLTIVHHTAPHGPVSRVFGHGRIAFRERSPGRSERRRDVALTSLPTGAGRLQR
jgi:hypothetical protein